MYRGNGAGGWVTGSGEPIGSGWQGFTALLAPGDFSGDGKPDVLARTSGGALLMYRGNGAGGWVTGSGEPIGSGWQGFTALAARGDFSGDGNPDILARQSDGVLLMYRGNGRGGFITGPAQQIGTGWQSLTRHHPDRGGQAARRRRPPPPPPPSAPLPDGRVQLDAGVALHPAGRAAAGQPPRPQAPRPPAPARGPGRVLRARRAAAGRPPQALRRPPADTAPGGPQGPRLRARVLPPPRHAQAAPQDRGAPLRHVRLRRGA